MCRIYVYVSIRMLYDSLVGQCEYTTRVPFGAMLLMQVGVILLVVLINKFVLVLFHSSLGMW